MAGRRPSRRLRDAALGYASRGIPVLPLHHPITHRHWIESVSTGQPLVRPGVGTACSCGDPACGQVAKHPLGALVPHGVKDATCTGPGSWPGGPATPRPTSASPPVTGSMSWTSTAPKARRPSGP
jgi:hypothetical protein